MYCELGMMIHKANDSMETASKTASTIWNVFLHKLGIGVSDLGVLVSLKSIL